MLAGVAERQQRLAHGVKRGGADVAVDDAERGDGQAVADPAVRDRPPHECFCRHGCAQHEKADPISACAQLPTVE